MNKRTLWILGAIVLIAIPTSYFAYAATLGVSSAKVTVHRQGATIAVPSPTPSPVSTPSSPPSSTGPTSKSCTLRSSQDAYIDEAAGKTVNFGTQSTMAVRSERGKKNRRSFLRFDIASCALPSGTTIDSASLKLTSASAASGRTYVLHRVSTSWTESGITNSPEPGVVASSSGSVASGASLTWTVTSDVKAFVSNPSTNFGWRVSDSAEDASTGVESTFHTREASTETARPTLVINYTS